MSEVVNDATLSENEDGESSPDSQCRICLGKLKKKSFPDTCLHRFCFDCLVEWSKVKTECPLCKTQFKSIIHSVRSNSDFKQHFVPIMVHNPNSYSGSLRLLSITRIIPRRRTPNSRSSVSYRASVYSSNLWSRPLLFGDACRFLCPDYFRDNPARRARIRPWLRREFSALVPHRNNRRLAEEVLTLLERWHIDSTEFEGFLKPILRRNYNHFLHEFKNFASSYFDMAGYDESVRYRPRIPESTPPPPNAVSNESSESSEVADNDDDVEVVGFVGFGGSDARVTISLDSDSDIEIIYPEIEEVLLSSESSDEISAPETVDQSTNPEREVNDFEGPSTSRSTQVRELRPRTSRKRTNEAVEERKRKKNHRGTKKGKKKSRKQSSSSDSTDDERLEKKAKRKKKSERGRSKRSKKSKKRVESSDEDDVASSE